MRSHEKSNPEILWQRIDRSSATGTHGRARQTLARDADDDADADADAARRARRGARDARRAIAARRGEARGRGVELERRRGPREFDDDDDDDDDDDGGGAGRDRTARARADDGADDGEGDGCRRDRVAMDRRRRAGPVRAQQRHHLYDGRVHRATFTGFKLGMQYVLDDKALLSPRCDRRFVWNSDYRWRYLCHSPYKLVGRVERRQFQGCLRGF